MGYRQKLNRIIGVTGWSRDHLADLLGVSNMSLMRWLKREPKLQKEHAAKVDQIYDGTVKVLACEIDRLADEVEKKMLSAQMKDLDKDNCPV